jgi:hypothetical protein
MYVPEFLQSATSPRSPGEIAEGTIYSESEIKDICSELQDSGIITAQNGNKYTSNNQTNEIIQDDIFGRIRRSYDTYLDKFARSGAISIGGDGSEESPYPLKSSIASEPENFRANYFGKVLIGEEDKHFLTRDNTLPEITELSFRNLERLPILLIKILWVAIHQENKEYWKFTYEVFEILYDETDWETMSMNSAIRTLFHLVLSSVNPPPTHQFTSQSMSGEDYSREVLSNTNFIAAFVAYPALESFIKYQCSSDIDMDGTIKQDQTVQDYSPRNDRDFYDKGDQCSSLRDLLIHFEMEVADERLQEQLEQIRKEISDLAEYPESKIYGLIYQWRNTLSHQATTDVKFGILLNIICMLIWHEVNERIDS